MSKQHITVLVSNDLEFDQRVRKVCASLQTLGYEITLVGRLLKTSQNIERPYEVKRFQLWFSKGAFFYAHLNLRLFFYLLFKKTDVILANDLDTLLPAYLVSRIRGRELVYDSHEYFTEAEGLTGRIFQKKVWETIEGWIFPKLKRVYTVNESIANIYKNKYRVNVRVVRNIPEIRPLGVLRNRIDVRLPLDKFIMILQGAYIDPDRGALEALQSLQYLDNVLLLIIGSGREMPLLKEMSSEPIYRDKVMIMDKMPFADLMQYTMNADLGLTLDKPLHLNYKYSLPNKLFDYIHAGVPVLASNLPELNRIITQYKVGFLIEKTTPESIAAAVNEIKNSRSLEEAKEACFRAKNELNWQREEQVLKEIFSQVL
jgi:glycosyltransferase involved in cell wall biosynthesis